MKDLNPNSNIPNLNITDVLDDKVKDSLSWNSSDIGRNSISNYLALLLKYANETSESNAINSLQDITASTIQSSFSSYTLGSLAGAFSSKGTEPASTSTNSFSSGLSSFWGLAYGNTAQSNNSTTNIRSNTFNILQAHLAQTTASSAIDYSDRGLTPKIVLDTNKGLFKKSVINSMQLTTLENNIDNNEYNEVIDYIKTLDKSLGNYKKGLRSSRMQVDELTRSIDIKISSEERKNLSYFISNNESESLDDTNTKKSFNLDNIPEYLLSENFNPETKESLSIILGNDIDWNTIYNELSLDGPKKADNVSNTDGFNKSTSNIHQSLKVYNGYLSHVERELILELSQKSDIFFESSNEVTKLRDYVNETYEDIDTIRKELESIYSSKTQVGIKILRNIIRRGNMCAIYYKLKIIIELLGMIQLAQTMNTQEDYISCLSIINNIKPLLTSVTASNSSPQDNSVENIINSHIRLIDVNENNMIYTGQLGSYKSLNFLRDMISSIENDVGLSMKNRLVGISICSVIDMLTAVNYRTYISSKPSTYKEIPSSADKRFYHRYISNVPLHFGEYYGAIRSLLDLTKFLNSTVIDIHGTDIDAVYKVSEITSELSPVVVSLFNTNNLSEALSSYKADLIKVAKVLFKKIIPDSNSIDYGQDFDSNTPVRSTITSNKPQSLAQIIRETSYLEFLHFCIATFVMTYYETRRAILLHNVFMSIIKEKCISEIEFIRKPLSFLSNYDQIAEDTSIVSTTDVPDSKTIYFIDGGASLHMSLLASKTLDENLESRKLREKQVSDCIKFSTESLDVVQDISEFGQSRCTKLLGVKLENLDSDIKVEEFCQILKFFDLFFDFHESVCIKGSSTLRRTTTAHAKSFVEHSTIKKLAIITDYIAKEKWASVDDINDKQSLVNKILSISKLYSSTNSSDNLSWVNFKEDIDTPKQIGNKLVINGESYQLVEATLKFIDDVAFYICCIVELPKAIFPDIFNKFCDCLRLFNSKVCESVLGASAVDTAGLRNVSTRHIALASQTLSLVRILSDSTRPIIKRQLPKRQILFISELERIISNLDHHRDQLFRKLISIIESFSMLKIDQLIVIDWDTLSRVDNSIKSDIRTSTDSRSDLLSLSRQSSTESITPSSDNRIIERPRRNTKSSVSSDSDYKPTIPEPMIKVSQKSRKDETMEIEITAVMNQLVEQIRTFSNIVKETLSEPDCQKILKEVFSKVFESISNHIKNKIIVHEEIGKKNLNKEIEYLITNSKEMCSVVNIIELQECSDNVRILPKVVIPKHVSDTSSSTSNTDSNKNNIVNTNSNNTTVDSTNKDKNDLDITNSNNNNEDSANCNDNTDDNTNTPTSTDTTTKDNYNADNTNNNTNNTNNNNTLNKTSTSSNAFAERFRASLRRSDSPIN